MRRLFLLVAIAGCGAASAPRPAVSVLTLDPPAAVLLVGESLQLHALPLDASGNHLSNRPITYHSADPLVSTVSATGLVKALAQGHVNISAMCEGQTAETVIDSKLGAVIGTAGGMVSILNGAVVLQIPVGGLTADTRITVDAADGLPSGPRLFVSGTGFRLGPANLAFQKAASLTLRYDPAVVPAALSSSIAMYSLDGASWDAVNGSVLDIGSKAVTAPLDGTGTFALRAPGPVASLTVVPSNVLVVLGTTYPLSAELRDSAGNLLQNRPITWSSSDTLTAKVSQLGLVSGVGIGITRVGANSGGASGSSTILVAILCSCPAPSAGTVQMGSGAQTACASAGGAPAQARHRVP
jgi:uncharacterized protein YjdB